MVRPALEVADVFRRHGPAYREAHGGSMTSGQRRIMRDIEVCRTAALGGHVDECDACGHRVISYNSCRNRHCGKCQSLAKAEWLEKQAAQLLPVPYFHVVFTVPESMAAVALQNKRVVYRILFQSAAEALRRIARDPKHLGAKVGFLAVLHTWGQTLHHHPHVHCVVPGGGLSPGQDRWVGSRRRFFLPVRVLSRLFRGIFLQRLEEACAAGEIQFHGQMQRLNRPEKLKRLLKDSCRTGWVVYCKPPFGGPSQVLDYLGRYTHRVAISNHRLIRLEDGQVTFRWHDYGDGNKQKLMTLKADEFIRRFLLHALPRGFVRIRHYGFLANARREKNLRLCRQLLNVAAQPDTYVPEPEDWKARYERLTGQSLTICPACSRGRMITVQTLHPSHLSWWDFPSAINSS
jgi:hypothetical protein